MTLLSVFGLSPPDVKHAASDKQHMSDNKTILIFFIISVLTYATLFTTFTVTVAVLPEAEEADVKINPGDVRVDVMRAGGPGGQCVNTTDSAVRLTHIPTGIVISCQDEKSQLKNKDKAIKVLRARLYDLEQSKAHDAEAELRKSQIGTGDRAEKIRTYNFPQGRVTDHRIKLTLHRLDDILNGDLGEMSRIEY